MKYWYVITFKNQHVCSFDSYQQITLDLSKPVLTIEFVSTMWKDKTNTISLVTSEILYIKCGENRDDD